MSKISDIDSETGMAQAGRMGPYREGSEFQTRDQLEGKIEINQRRIYLIQTPRRTYRNRVWI